MNARLPRSPHSFSTRIGWLVALTTATAVICVSLALAVINHRNLRSAAFAALRAQTDIAAINSGAPLVFGDSGTATEVLQAFRALPSVSAATLYSLDGKPFARYRRSAQDDGQPAILVPGLFDQGDRVVTVTTVQEKGQSLGRLQVVYDLSDLNQQLWRNLLLAGAICLGTIALALFLSLRITRVVIRPLARLTQTAREISRTRDYALRAPKLAGDDEIAAFSDTFNDMLGQIQRQDEAVKESRTQAVAASRLKDEFLATLSHELRTPMTPILGWAQILKRIAGDDGKVMQAAEVIERNALAQTRLVDDLLDMSRIISGKIRLDMQAVDLPAVAAAAIEAVREAALARDIQLDTTLPANLPPLRGDPQRLQQVLWNLLSNAIKFTPHGGRVQLIVSPQDGDMLLAVQDSGQGIPPEFLPHVFERFRQVDSSITRTHGGLGLGLAIVKQLVELHGGTVRADSQGEGRGARFTVRLPLRPASIDADADAAVPSPTTDPDASTALDAVDASRLQAMHVLVVDNEPDARDWLQQLLRERGASVQAAATAEAALEAIKTHPPDILVSDIGMPGTDGYALIQRVRALPPAEGGLIPAIALTAFARAEDRDRALRAGYQMHLGKPVDAETLVAAILGLVPAA